MNLLLHLRSHGEEIENSSVGQHGGSEVWCFQLLSLLFQRTHFKLLDLLLKSMCWYWLEAIQFQKGEAIYKISISLRVAMSIYMHACMWAFWLLSTFRKQLQESISCVSAHIVSLKQWHDLHPGTVGIPDGSARQQGSKPVTPPIFLWLLLSFEHITLTLRNIFSWSCEQLSPFH